MAERLTAIRNIFRRPADQRGHVVAVGPSQIGVWPQKIESERYDPYAALAYKASGVVFACMGERRRVFSDVELVWQRLRDRRTFTSQDLDLLQRPWQGGTSQDLLDRMMVHNDLGGNAFAYVAESQFTGRRIIQLLRPDWVEIVLDAAGAEIAAYLYTEGGKYSGNEPRILGPDEVAHWYTTPDPHHPYKGMSWLTPVLTEIEADKQTVRHQQKFFQNAATPNLLVTVEKRIESEEARSRFRTELDRRFAGWENAYRTMILDDGADAKVIGASLEQAQFTEVQAANENRIVTASEVPPILIAVSKGLDASTYSNFGQASRSFATKMRPKWKSVVAKLGQLVAGPAGARLWFDDSDNSAMREDAKDQAEVQQKQAVAIRTYVDGGFDPDSAVAAIAGNELRLLDHSGLASVQLQPIGQNGEPAPAADATTETTGTAPADMDDAKEIKLRADTAGLLIRSGFDAQASLDAAGLAPIKHVGALPVTLQPAAAALQEMDDDEDEGDDDDD